MREKKMAEKFIPLDPDELVLEKDYVLGVLKLVGRRWEENGTELRFRIGLKAFRFGLKATPEKIFANFWKQILMFINLLLYENGKAQAKQRGEKWIDVLGQIPSIIDEGRFDID